MDSKDYYTFDEDKDELTGRCGAPERDKYEAEIEAYLNHHLPTVEKNANVGYGSAVRRGRV